ncbi:MAG: acetylornithine transaminase, partial [Actinomycetales bacterium]|nr:acetylornithine transaminase [Actinomycetales bacterium]
MMATNAAAVTTGAVPSPASGPDDLAARWSAAMLPNYGTPAIVIDHGRGCEVFDTEGRRYLDFVAGIAVSSLGHAHPAVVAAVSEQVAKVAHTSNLYAHDVGLRLAQRLQSFMPVDSRVFFCQDGATAIEAALKIVRRWAVAHPGADGDGQPRARQSIVAAENSFHGRTFGALAVTGSPGKREPFAPFAHDVRFVPFGDADALAAAVDDTVAAIVLEPIQGEAGVVVPPAGYLRRAREIADLAGCLLVVDEVQSGIGRTGAWLASVDQGVVPDILTLAKGLAAGLPLGAVIATGAAMTALVPGDHGSTFGGNPVSCAAALAVLDTIESDGLLDAGRRWGDAFAAGIAALAHPLIAGSRGAGAWHAIQVTSPIAGALESGLRERGVLVNAVKTDALRVCPPLIVTEAHLHEFL